MNVLVDPGEYGDFNRWVNTAKRRGVAKSGKPQRERFMTFKAFREAYGRTRAEP